MPPLTIRRVRFPQREVNNTSETLCFEDVSHLELPQSGQIIKRAKKKKGLSGRAVQILCFSFTDHYEGRLITTSLTCQSALRSPPIGWGAQRVAKDLFLTEWLIRAQPA